MAFLEHPVPRKRGPTGEHPSGSPLPASTVPLEPLHVAQRGEAEPRSTSGSTRPARPRPTAPISAPEVAALARCRRSEPYEARTASASNSFGLYLHDEKRSRPVDRGRDSRRRSRSFALARRPPSASSAITTSLASTRRRRAGRATHRLAHRVLVVLRRVLLSLGWWHCQDFGG
jgi:hypothetical protein